MISTAGGIRNSANRALKQTLRKTFASKISRVLGRKWAGWLSRGHLGGWVDGWMGGQWADGGSGGSANVCQTVKTIANGLLGGEQSQLSSPPSPSQESVADIWQSELESSCRAPLEARSSGLFKLQ